MRTNNNILLDSILEIISNIDIKTAKKFAINNDKAALLDYINKEYLNVDEYKALISSTRFNKENLIELLYEVLLLVTKNNFKKNESLNISQKLIKNASECGFTWPNSNSCFSKIEEEFIELKKAVKEKNKNNILEEMGDLIFTLQCFAYVNNFDFIDIIDSANNKFDKRFTKLQKIAKSNKINLKAVSSKIKEKLWQQAKKDLKSS
jgi:phosphoribosyl-ATP pyrophosphohydrolase